MPQRQPPITSRTVVKKGEDVLLVWRAHFAEYAARGYRPMDPPPAISLEAKALLGAAVPVSIVDGVAVPPVAPKDDAELKRQPMIQRPKAERAVTPVGDKKEEEKP